MLACVTAVTAVLVFFFPMERLPPEGKPPPKKSAGFGEGPRPAVKIHAQS